jgi:hypothetical protein
MAIDNRVVETTHGPVRGTGQGEDCLSVYRSLILADTFGVSRVSESGFAEVLSAGAVGWSLSHTDAWRAGKVCWVSGAVLQYAEHACGDVVLG